MPPLALVPGVFKAQLKWNDAADIDVSTTLFFRYTGTAPTSSEANTIAGVITTQVGDLADNWPADTVLTGATVTDLSTDEGGEGFSTVSIAGGDENSPLAGGTCFLVNFQIARRYRGGKPRNYLPWGSSLHAVGRQGWESSAVAGWTSSYRSAIAAVVGTTAGACTVGNHCNVSYWQGSHVVISPTTGRARNVPIPRDTPKVDDVTAIVGSTLFASQRRRNRA
jgi:hypothetical protein